MTVRKRKDGRWQYDIVIWRGEERIRDRGACRGARNKSEAQAFERKRRAELEEGAPAKAAHAVTFRDHAEEMMRVHAAVENKHSEQLSKRGILDRHLLPVFGGLSLTAIDARQVAHYKATKIGAGLSPKTVNNHLAVLRKALGLAKEWGRLRELPTIKFLAVPDPEFDFLTFEEADRLLAAADPEWRPMILTGMRAGLRQGELLELRWDDVDLVAGRLMVRRAIYDGVVDTPKGGRSREVPMGEELRSALRAARHLKGELVFSAPNGERWTKGETKWPLWRACKRGGLRRIGWHVLRHTFGSHLAMRGVPLKVIQELMGHASIEMTMRYAHLSPDIGRDAVKLLDSAEAGAGGRVTAGSRSERR